MTADVLKIDPAATAARIEAGIRENVLGNLRRKGAVVAISGGVDSSVVAALCVRALGSERVFGLFLPEKDSSPHSLRLGRLLARLLGIRSCAEDITPVLEAAGCYRRRDDAIRAVIPEYGEGYQCKIVLPQTLEASYPAYSVVVKSPAGAITKARLNAEACLAIIAATNFKQRTRKMMEYYYADRYNYAVAGTPNRLEYDQGFFVKNGDGAADFKPIAHLYKTEVYQLAEFLGIPEEIRTRPSTTDTYPMEQSQEEFYFALPSDKMDLCLYAKNHGIPAAEAAGAIGIPAESVEHVYRVIDTKRKSTRYLHQPPLLIEKIGEIPLG